MPRHRVGLSTVVRSGGKMPVISACISMGSMSEEVAGEYDERAAHRGGRGRANSSAAAGSTHRRAARGPHLIDEVVGDYLDRAMRSSLPPLGDAQLAARAVLDAVAGFGPLQPLLDDPTVEEIWINEPGRVFVARRGRVELTTVDPVRRRGRRSRRADAADLRAAGSTCRPRSSTPMLPDGSPAARRHPGHHPTPLGGEHPQVRRRRSTRSTSSSPWAR